MCSWISKSTRCYGRWTKIRNKLFIYGQASISCLLVRKLFWFANYHLSRSIIYLYNLSIDLSLSAALTVFPLSVLRLKMPCHIWTKSKSDLQTILAYTTSFSTSWRSLSHKGIPKNKSHFTQSFHNVTCHACHHVARQGFCIWLQPWYEYDRNCTGDYRLLSYRLLIVDLSLAAAWMQILAGSIVNFLVQHI